MRQGQAMNRNLSEGIELAGEALLLPRSLRAGPAGAAALAILLAALAPADAGWYGAPHGRHEQAKKEPAKPLQVPLIAISIADQRLTLYDKGVAVAHAPVSTGMPGHPTPTGVFSVIEKEVFHRSNIYSGAPMPFMQRITWSGVALHAGVLPGYPASHGCIRMPGDFAVKLFHMTRRGARVIVAHGAVVPVPFEDPHLFTLAKPATDHTAELSAPVAFYGTPGEMVRTAQSQTRAVASDAGGQAMEMLVGLPRPDVATFVPAANAMNNVAEAEPAKAAADPASATISGARSGKAATTGANLSGGAITGIGLVEPVRIVPPQPVPTTTTFAPANAPAAAPPPSGAQSMLEPDVSERPLRPGPITVFVSRKEGKVFVRKGFEQILAIPVTIAHPELALGTHLYTAIDAKPDGASFDWVAVSVAAATGKKADARHVRDRRGRPETAVKPATPPPSAAEALDRIEFPPEALARISSLMSPGATLIISDQGLGPETGLDTDFIVLTR